MCVCLYLSQQVQRSCFVHQYLSPHTQKKNRKLRTVHEKEFALNYSSRFYCRIDHMDNDELASYKR
jgi:hypothetical protein